MQSKPIGHGTFVIERVYEASTSEVFAAWTDLGLKERWFVGPEGWTAIRRGVDVRVGGSEVLHGRLASGLETLFTARYHDVVDGERLVYVYDMHLDGRLHSTSLATVELRPAGQATRQTFTEQVAFLDGTEGAQGTASRERGTAAHLDRIGKSLRERR